MKNLKLLAFYLLALFICGCIPSLHPLFKNDQIIQDPRIVGYWAADDSNNIWEIKATEKGYEGIYIDESGKVGKFNVAAGKIGNNLFLDIYPKDASLSENNFYKLHLVAAHTFIKAQVNDKAMELWFINPESLEKILKADANAIQHERLENGSIVLTASSEKIQQFLLKYGANEEFQLFGKPLKATKLK
ncbi:MAG: hypothetical protein ABFD79_09400 [Phycisphaerales bacterium]